jgi:uncharacterized protein
MSRESAVLIVAASGRALAASARRGGLAPLVADWFGDQDTLAAAAAHRLLPRGLAHGMEPDAVLAALEELARDGAPVGVVCGTGFEDRPELLARIAERWPLIGNRAATVTRAKDPDALAALARDCDVPHPAIAWEQPDDPERWLVKRHGGSGGGHIKTAMSAPGATRYFQRRVPGAAISALILADGRDAAVLGFSEQWCAPTAQQPFRYGGAVTPAHMAPRVTAALEEVIGRLVAAAPLSGLNSIDFLIDGDDVWLLEINPRPGATVDLFEPEQGSLLAWHIAACGGSFGPVPIRDLGARAGAIVYAEASIACAPRLEWPDWTADRPQPGTAIAAGAPLCTVLAAAVTSDEAKRLVVRRIRTVLSWMHARAA